VSISLGDSPKAGVSICVDQQQLTETADGKSLQTRSSSDSRATGVRSLKLGQGCTSSAAVVVIAATLLINLIIFFQLDPELHLLTALATFLCEGLKQNLSHGW
jgi:hypothetical protein